MPADNLISQMKNRAAKPPGHLEFAMKGDTEKTRISLISYSENFYNETEIEDVKLLPDSFVEEGVHWVKVTGFQDTTIIEQLGHVLNIHPLLLEDILNIEHFSKSEEIDEHLFLTLNILKTMKNSQVLDKNHISFVLGGNYLVSFVQKSTDIFDNFSSRIENSIGKVRSRKNDYLFYRLTDIIVDNYFLLFENFEDRLEKIEDELLRNQSANLAAKIQVNKKALLYLRRNIYPVYESIRSIQKSDGKHIRKQTHNFINDTADHLNQLVQTIENYRETITSLMELQMANNSNRMNNVMKTLTLISTVFIPLTFLTGIYGMNFEYMPELKMKWAYPAFLGMVLIIGTGMWFYMKRKKWF